MLKFGSAVLGVFLGALATASAQIQPPVPMDAIAAIVAAFETHSIVTIADDHGDQQVLADRAYLDERLRRLALGGPPGSADRLKEYCGSGGGGSGAR